MRPRIVGHKQPGIKINLVGGETFGRLTYIKDTYYGKRGRYALFKCVCGNTKEAHLFSVRNGGIKSCGCLYEERAGKPLSHGKTILKKLPPEYILWMNIKMRCHNKNNPGFRNYGARGIQMCQEWKNNFLAFFNYVGPRPSPTHSLDRINNDGNYEPGNIRWTTREIQSRNRRTNRILTVDGISHCVCDWGKISGIDRNTIYQRLKRGLSPKEAIFMPVKHL